MDEARTAYRLERGSTGFRSFGDPPVPDTDPGLCRTAWYAAARAARGQVLDFTGMEHPQTFHTATLADRNGTHIALFHAHHPLIAFVDAQHSWYPCDAFLDPPAWAPALADFGFTLLTTSQLSLPLRAADTSALTAGEWKHIEHWRPDTVGEVLFNSWD
ncbi:hypothetical protein [Streptomyces sp. NPDC046909]|uniref:hypothetical protein n=1 Tax=Streptomyces sp. NPDC046909 TaxID=3155617 RepID=UPI0033F464C6